MQQQQGMQMQQQGQPMMQGQQMQGQQMQGQQMQGQQMQGQPVMQGQPMQVGGPMIMQPVMMMMAPMDISQCNNLLVKQTRRGCLQEMMGCDANTEFLISTMDQPQNNIMYGNENTPFWIRFCCKNQRPYTINVSNGSGPGGPALADFNRPFACVAGPEKCCCYQRVLARAPGTETELGRVTETYYCFVPQFKVNNGAGETQYNLQMPTCCAGMCVDLCAEGCCNMRIPFYIFPPGKREKGEEVGKIVKVWGGWGKELFTDADTFELQFPPNSDVNTKLTLLGGVFLLNQLYFERSGGTQGLEL